MPLNKKAGGRKKGTPNKTTALVRERIMLVMDECFSVEKISADLSALSPINRLKVYLELVPYVCAKPKEEPGDGGEGMTIEEAVNKMLHVYEGKN